MLQELYEVIIVVWSRAIACYHKRYGLGLFLKLFEDTYGVLGKVFSTNLSPFGLFKENAC
jgi:hypothetical protein